MDGAIARLHLRAPPGHAATTRARTEDALRLAAPDDRLLILRRLDLGRLGVRSTPSAWNARAAERVATLRHQAVHAATPGAGSAGAVWFHSAAEAEALLLLELASGRTPTAWFWRLAVPDWRGVSLSPWLARWIAEAATEPRREVALALATIAVAAAGRLAAMVAALAAVPPPPTVRPDRASDPPLETGAGFRPSPRKPADGTTARVHRILARHDPVVRAAIRSAIATGRAEGTAERWIARLGLLAVAPELAAHPALLAEYTAELLACIVPTSTAASAAWVPDAIPPPGAGPGPSTVRASKPRPPKPAAERAQPKDGAPSPAAATMEPTIDTGPAPGSGAAASPDRPRATSRELESIGAGVFLLIRPLVLMGLPDWLDRRPTLAADGFGRALLRGIAERMRIPEDDPLFVTLSTEPAGDWSVPLTAWRVGLDRWLRRTARIRLADVVRRRGWILADIEGISVRFRVSAADIRLRRHALDVDPGWVPWLGQLVRYQYRDEPLLEPCA